jgi:hypothetical protein
MGFVSYCCIYRDGLLLVFLRYCLNITVGHAESVLAFDESFIKEPPKPLTYAPNHGQLWTVTLNLSMPLDDPLNIEVY